MDRASDSGSEGWGFESLPAYQKMREGIKPTLIFCCAAGLEGFIRNSPGDCCRRRRTLQFAQQIATSPAGDGQ